MQDNNRRFIICALGIFFSYFYFGILQEKITKGKYPYEVTNDAGNKVVENEKFTYTLSLVFAQCLINYLLMKITLYFWPQGEDNTSSFYYGSVSLTYLLAMICSNLALQWVSYPTQVVGKSAKPIPVLILGVILGNKSYSLRKYVFIFLIVIGVILFMYKDKAPSKLQDSSFGVGEILIILSLTMDGLTGAIQERIRAESSPTGYHMMKTTNAWSTLYLLVALLVSGEIFRFIEFAGRHPSVLSSLLTLGMTQAVGQLFLYSMVSDFGPLVVSIVTTTRKFFTVLASVILFGNALTSRQWIGTVMVFAGLFLDAFYSKSAPKKKEHKQSQLSK